MDWLNCLQLLGCQGETWAVRRCPQQNDRSLSPIRYHYCLWTCLESTVKIQIVLSVHFILKLYYTIHNLFNISHVSENIVMKKPS
jgi:hypothetical protein